LPRLWVVLLVFLQTRTAKSFLRFRTPKVAARAPAWNTHNSRSSRSVLLFFPCITSLIELLVTF
jgi:hypothetical protein